MPQHQPTFYFISEKLSDHHKREKEREFMFLNKISQSIIFCFFATMFCLSQTITEFDGLLNDDPQVKNSLEEFQIEKKPEEITGEYILEAFSRQVFSGSIDESEQEANNSLVSDPELLSIKSPWGMKNFIHYNHDTELAMIIDILIINFDKDIDCALLKYHARTYYYLYKEIFSQETKVYLPLYQEMNRHL